MTENKSPFSTNISKAKTFEELTDIYHKFKQQSKIENNLQEMKFEPIVKYVSDMCNELVNDGSGLYLRLKTIEVSLMYDQSRAFLSKQKTSFALVILKKALQIIEKYKLNPKITYLYFRILNQLAYFLAQNNELKESLDLLENAEKLYEKLENTSEILIFDTEDLFQEICPQKKKNIFKFEKLISNNFHLQGWIYNRQHLTEKFIMYHHIVLKRQLETQDGSALLWVFKCARLASYFFGVHKFSEARYLLAASCHVLREYELDLLMHRSEAHFAGEWTNLQKYYADIGKYWVKYGLFLFEASRRSSSNITSDATINDILIKSFKDSSRKSQPFKKISKEKLETIIEKPEDTEFSKNHELPTNNESTAGTKDSFPLNKLNKSTVIEQSSKEELSKNDQLETIVVSKIFSNETTDTKSAINEDVAEITKSIIDKIDDQLSEKNDNRQCVAKYVSMLDNLVGVTNSATSTKATSSTTSLNIEDVKSSVSEEKKNYKFLFPNLCLQDFESKVTNELITTLESARSLFLFTQEWVKRSKAYYSIHDFPFEYVNLILDLNELYRYLSMYEVTVEMQYDVQKRRVDLLERLSSLLKENRPQFYLSLNIELVNELTQAQIELILLNIRRLNLVQTNPHQISSKESFQQKDEAFRRMDALLEIRKRLTRKDSGINFGVKSSSFAEHEIV